jgi:hypothetical protein
VDAQLPQDDTATARIAALEAQVAALTARLGVEAPAAEAYDRRALLRRGGAVLAAGVAGAVALPGGAAATEGDPVLAGRAVDAGPTPTVLTGGSADASTLVLSNPATGTADGRAVAGPALRLTASPAPGGLDDNRSQAGDLASSGDLLWYGHTSATATAPAVTGAVYTSAFANHLELLSEPRRVLDTRSGPSTDENGSPNDRRTRVVAGRFETGGRLIGGSALVLDLSGLVVGGVAVFANLTVVAPAAGGFLTAYPTPEGAARTDGLDRPAASNLNYALVALGAGARITVFTTTTAHVLLDLTAVSVREPFSLTEPGVVTGALRAR